MGIWIEPLYFDKDCTWGMLQIMGAVSEEIEDINECDGIVYNLCNSSRNLKDDQIKAIGGRNGVIGVNSWVDFVDKNRPSAEKLANHIDYIVNLIGIDHVGFGFEFGDYIDLQTLSSFQEENYVKTPGIEDASRIPNLLNILKKRGYNNEDLERISYKNMERVVQNVLT
ncbi:dipeptidase [Clostridium sp. JNZ X4-2]